jgi:hypothetical protein
MMLKRTWIFLHRRYHNMQYESQEHSQYAQYSFFGLKHVPIGSYHHPAQSFVERYDKKREWRELWIEVLAKLVPLDLPSTEAIDRFLNI